MMIRARRLVVLASLLPLGACATKRDLRDLQTEIRANAARQDSIYIALDRLIRSTRDSVMVYSDAVFNFRGDINNRLQIMEDQLLRLGELTGQSQRSLAGLRDQIETQRRVEATRPPPTIPQRDSTQAAEGEVDRTFAGVQESAEEMYNAALEQFNRGSFNVAGMAFRRFLEQYPTHALASKAHLKVGELMTQSNDLEGAAAEYLKVRERFPNSPDVPEALYRAGALYLEMENFPRARQYLEQVVNTYPDHAVAQLAQDRLSDIP